MTSKVNIVTFPHSVTQIKDQLDFLTLFMQNSNIMYQISNSISTACPNILVEGFSTFYASEVIKFCQAKKTKIVMVLTEHLELIGNKLIINETDIHSDREYMADAVTRFKTFFSLLPYVRFFITLGHLPLPDKLSQVIKNIPIIDVPYARLDVGGGTEKTIDKITDFSYQGALTSHRLRVLKKIKRLPASVTTSFDAEERARILTLQRSRYAVQIPQHRNWRYISTMRALFCLKHGVPMINISDHVMHEFDDIFPRVSPSNLQELDKYLLRSSEKCYREILEKYNAYVDRQPKSKLPTMIQLWADLDGISP